MDETGEIMACPNVLGGKGRAWLALLLGTIDLHPTSDVGREECGAARSAQFARHRPGAVKKDGVRETGPRAIGDQASDRDALHGLCQSTRGTLRARLVRCPRASDLANEHRQSQSEHQSNGPQ